ncbi:MAG: hypothetical protein ACI9EF_001731 [Pseudohongiellaceae bacterium]
MRCLAEDATRDEALLDLAQQADWARREQDDDQLPQLNPSQEASLVELFVKDVSVRRGDGRFAELLDDIDCQDDRWEFALVAKLADSSMKLDTAPGQWCALYAVSILARRLGDVQLQAWEKEFRTQPSSREGTPRARELLADSARRARSLLLTR